MGSLLLFVRKLLLLPRRRQLDDDLAEEMTFHRQQAERELRFDGVPPDEARYAAMRQLGNAVLLREDARDTLRFGFESVLLDVRYAARQLRQNPGLALTAIVVLALGIGATTAIFSALHPILFASLPYPEPRSVTMLWERGDDGGARYINFADAHGLATRSRSFTALAAMKPWQPTMTGPYEPERLEGQRVGAPYFRVLGIRPALGRDFSPADDVAHGANLVILGDALWRRRFAASPAIVGRQIKLDDELYTVIGVLPRDFENVTASQAELWAPLQYDAALPLGGREWGHHLRLIGRLQPGVPPAHARGELDVIVRGLARDYASGYTEAGGPPSGYLVNPLQDELTRDVRPALVAVLGAALLVLVIACVNVTSLLLARGVRRRGELAVRAALGAGGARIARQLASESLLLALVGGGFGVLVARLGIVTLVALSPADLPRLHAIRLDGAVFAFALLLTTVVGLLVGLVPALHAARSDPHDGLQQSSRRAASGHHWTRRALVVAEVALALVLLVSAGLLLRSLQRVFSVEPGFDPSHLLTMQVQESGHRYRKGADRLRFFQQALDRVRQLPGVVSAGFTSQLPLSGEQDVYGMMFEQDDSRAGEPAFRYAVTPGYLEAMRIPLLRGRLLSERDGSPDAPRVVLINESFARKKLRGQDPIGRRVCVRCDASSGRAWSTIVGVVGDVRQLSLELASEDAVYLPSSRWYWADDVMSLAVRTRGDAAALAPEVRRAIWSVDKDQPIVRVATMERLVADSQAQRRFAETIFEAFALVALVLAATGVYGILAGSVSERTREIGVRATLGATPAMILGLVVRQALWLTLFGVGAGLLGALAATRALGTLLFGVSRLDPATYVEVTALLCGICVVACWPPAWRAAHVDPAITMRAE